MTLIQAQERYIVRVNACHPGHRNRVERAARKQLGDYIRANGTQSVELVRAIIVDANDMAILERNSDD